MPPNNSEVERLTEDEIARRKLGPRGVPGGEDSAKMTPQQEKNIPKEGEFDGHVAQFWWSAESARVRLLLAFQQISSLGARKPSGPSLARDFDVGSRRLLTRMGSKHLRFCSERWRSLSCTSVSCGRKIKRISTTRIVMALRCPGIQFAANGIGSSHESA